MVDMIENLEKFGLSQKEAKTYLACLDLGNSTASEISSKSRLPRTLVYDLLERLINLGLVSYAIKNNVKYFRAANPDQLIKILNEKETAVIEMLPMLQSAYEHKSPKKPKVEIYEGKEGLKAAMSDVLRSNTKEFLAYGSNKTSVEVVPNFINFWHKERIKKKIYARTIYNNTKRAKKNIKDFKKTMKFMEYKLSPIELDYPTPTVIYGDKILMSYWTRDEPFTIMIESKEMAEMQRRYFEELWKISKKP